MLQDYFHYRYFMDEFAPILVGVGNYSKCSVTKEPEDFLSTSAEAFALMSFDNYLDATTKESKNKTPEKGIMQGRYTKNTSAKKFGGMEKEGIDRYNELFKQVREARMDSRRMEHAKKYFEEKVQKFGSKQRKSKTKAGEEMTASIMCDDDIMEF